MPDTPHIYRDMVTVQVLRGGKGVLLRITATDFRKGVAFAGKGHLKLIPSVLDEHTSLEVREIVGGHYFENGCTITGGEVLHSWV